MKWFTLKSSEIRERGDSPSLYWTCRQGRKTASCVSGHGIIVPVSSLQ